MTPLEARRLRQRSFAVSAIVAAHERLGSMNQRAFQIESGLNMNASCTRLDALSTLLICTLVDVITDRIWIERWAQELPTVWPAGQQMLEEALENQDLTESNVVLAILATEWFHTMQHGEQKGAPANFEGLRQEKDAFEAVREGDPELAISIVMGNFLADNGSPENDPMDYDIYTIWDSFEPIVDAVREYMRPSVVDHIELHISAVQGVPEGRRTEAEAAEIMRSIHREHAERLKSIRVNRGQDAIDALKEEDAKSNPLLGLLKVLEDKIARELADRGGGKGRIDVMSMDEDGKLSQVSSRDITTEADTNQEAAQEANAGEAPGE